MESSDSTMAKLNKGKVKDLITKKKQGFSTRYVANKAGVGERRVQQLYKYYLETNSMPELKKTRRPRTFLSDGQKRIIEDVYSRHKVGARLLKLVLDQEIPNNRIAKNKIYEYLKHKGYSKPDKNKQKQRKRTRYERKHSGSLGHMDTHFCKWNPNIKLIAFMDDASRKVLAAHEGGNSNAEISIKVAKEAIKEAWKYRVLIKQINTDRGTEFFAAEKGKKQHKIHEFIRFLETQGIKHIPSRIKNPQTNGKLERWHQEYEKHRPSFSSLSAFIEWCNNRIHGELRNTPNKAFLNKLPPESLIGMLFQEDNNETKK